jgi:hypothetical protein
MSGSLTTGAEIDTTLGVGAVAVDFAVDLAANFGFAVFAFAAVVLRVDVLGVAVVLLGVLTVIFLASLFLACHQSNVSSLLNPVSNGQSCQQGSI